MSSPRQQRVRQPTAADWAFIAVCLAIGVGTFIGGLLMLISSS